MRRLFRGPELLWRPRGLSWSCARYGPPSLQSAHNGRTKRPQSGMIAAKAWYHLNVKSRGQITHARSRCGNQGVRQALWRVTETKDARTAGTLPPARHADWAAARSQSGASATDRDTAEAGPAAAARTT